MGCRMQVGMKKLQFLIAYLGNDTNRSKVTVDCQTVTYVIYRMMPISVTLNDS